MKYPLLVVAALAVSGCNSTDNSNSTATSNLQSNSAAKKEAHSVRTAATTQSVQPSEQDRAEKSRDVSVSQHKNDDEVIYILAHVPYSQPDTVADNVKQECHQLGQQFSNSLIKYAKAQRIAIKQVEGELPESGKVLQLAIDNVYSGGNAFIGHRKSASVSAKLVINGKQVDSTSKTRNSAGGFLGGFKGSCSVLAHTVNTLGNDIAKWAKANKHL